MNKKYLNSKYLGIYITLVIMALSLYLVGVYKKNIYEQYGVYSIGKVVKLESDAQGLSCYVDLYYNGKVYKLIRGNFVRHVGSFYYMRLLPDEPDSAELIDEEVPECVLERPIPPKGLKQKPKCN